jgi:hypothetical protein
VKHRPERRTIRAVECPECGRIYVHYISSRRRTAERRVEVVELWRHCDAVKDKTKVVRPHKFGLFLGRIFSGLLGLSGRS